MANIKLGNNTLTGVNTVKLQSADAAGEYVSFSDLVAQEKTAAVTANGTTEVTPDSGKTLSKVTITSNVPQAVPIEVSTAAAMTALLVAANVGKVYKFTGTTDSTYTNGDLYEVVNG